MIQAAQSRKALFPRSDNWLRADMLFRNAVTALEGGATHIDTSVLGIGERESSNLERGNSALTRSQETVSRHCKCCEDS